MSVACRAGGLDLSANAPARRVGACCRALRG